MQFKSDRMFLSRLKICVSKNMKKHGLTLVHGKLNTKFANFWYHELDLK